MPRDFDLVLNCLSGARRAAITLAAVVMVWIVAACGPGDMPATQPAGTPGAKLSGNVEIDGSSTVFPISQAVAEEFRKLHSRVQIPVGISGTGGGFKRFAAGEIDIADASRPIKASEIEETKKNGVEYVELAVAVDGLSVMVNKTNRFAECVTTAELKKIWEPGSNVKKWSDVRPEWPDKPVRLYGPGTDSGTFDYFTSVIMGTVDASRPDYTASENDNVLIQGVAGDRNSLGYFGFAYFKDNADKLKALAVDGGGGCVAPSKQTITDGSSQPLSRPLYIYVKKSSLSRAEVRAFVEFYLQNAATLAAEVGYVPLPAKDYQSQLATIK